MFACLVAGLRESAVHAWQLNVVLKFEGPNKEPADSLSLITPFFAPRVEEVQQYALLVMKAFEQRMQHPAWDRFVGRETIFAEAQRVTHQVLGNYCGDRGNIDVRRQHCHMILRGALKGQQRALQIIIAGTFNLYPSICLSS